MKLPKHLTIAKPSPKVLSMITFTLLPIIGFIVGHFYNPKTVVQVVEVKETPTTTPIPTSTPTAKEVIETPSRFFNKIFSIDAKRSNPEVCGYTEEIYEQIAKSIGLDKDTFLYRRSSGVWSFDCETYAYGMVLTRHNFFIEDQIGGIWTYKPSGKISKQLSRQYDDVARWLTKDLLVTGQFVMNVKSGAAVIPYMSDLYGEEHPFWIKYNYTSSEFSGATFPWSFMHPDNWEIDTANTVIKNDKVEILTFKTPIEGVSVRFYVEDPGLDISGYATDCGNSLDKYEYNYFCGYSPTVRPWKEPGLIYIRNKGSLEYPKAIVISNSNRSSDRPYDSQSANNALPDIFKTMRGKVDEKK